MAIATGSAVAQGQSPVKVKLANRLDRKRLAVHLEEADGVEVDQPGSAANTAPKRYGLAPSIHGSGSLAGDGLPSPLAVTVTTKAITVVMASYGAMMGQMAKGMLEGVGPQLMQMLQNFQVISLL